MLLNNKEVQYPTKSHTFYHWSKLFSSGLGCSVNLQLQLWSQNFRLPYHLAFMLHIICKFRFRDFYFETILESDVAWGFGFVQYCLEQENIFYDELCRDEDAILSCTTSCGNNSTCVDQCDEPFICEKAKSQYNFIYTVFQVSSTVLGVAFEPILQKFGFLVTRKSFKIFNFFKIVWYI